MKTILVDAYHTFVVEGEGVNQEMYRMLEEYPNQKIILTSANDEQMVEFGLNDMPYQVFTLKHDPEKTDPKYYQIMLERFGLTPEEVVYFEHGEEAVDTALSVGIITHHYDKDKKDLAEVKEFLDANL